MVVDESPVSAAFCAHSLGATCRPPSDEPLATVPSTSAPQSPPSTSSPSTSSPSSTSSTASDAELKDFLRCWKGEIQPKFATLLSTLSKTALAPAILSCQIFSYLPVLERGVQALQAEGMCLMASEGLEQFHSRCHTEGIALDAIGGGPMGQVWENGDVQVVQYPANLPSSVYPLDRFPGELLGTLGEVVYIPVYDGRIHGSPTPGIVGVVECMLNRNDATDMVVAKVISALSDILGDIGLSLHPPRQIPEEQSKRRESPFCDGIGRDGSFLRNERAFNAMQRTASQACFDMHLD